MTRLTSGIAAGLLLIGVPARSQPANAPVTPLQFARSYVTLLAKFARLRREAAAEAVEDKSDATRAALDCVGSNNVYDREAGLAVAEMDRIESDPAATGTAVQTTAHEIAENYKSRQGIARQMASACSAFAQGAKGEAEAAALAGTMAKLQGRASFVDSMGDGTAMMVIASLMSDRPDRDGHISGTTLSCSEKTSLTNQIEGTFGTDLEPPNSAPEATQARSIRDNLKTLKCADEQK